MKSIARRTAVIALLLGSVITPRQHASAQGTATIISGVVAGPNDKPIGGAIVEAKAEGGNSLRTTKSAIDGRYTIIFLSDSATAYTVTFKAIGHLPATYNVKKSAGDDRIKLNVSLKVSAVTLTEIKPSGKDIATIERAELGATDGIMIAVGVADVMVLGSPSDRISYRAFTRREGSSRADSVVFVGQAVPVEGTYEITASGLTINPPQNSSVLISVPRNLKNLHISVNGRGNVSVGSVDGEITVQSVAGNVTLNAVSGPALIEARNGKIEAFVPTFTSTMNFLAHNGDITLTTPSDARVSVQAEVHRGTITRDSTSYLDLPKGTFQMDADGTFESHRVMLPKPEAGTKTTWIMGGGGGAISLSTLNGNVVIRRALPKQ